MPAQTGFEDLGFTSSQPKSGGFEDLGFVTKGAPTVAAPPNAEELRAQRVRSASPQELRRIHFGENIPAGQQAEQVSPVSEFTQGALIRGPAKMIGGAANMVSDAFKTPQPMTLSQLRAQGGTAAAGGGMTPAQGVQLANIPVDMYKRLSSGTPTESGEAAFDVGATLLPMKGAMAEGIENSAAKLAAERAARHEAATHASLVSGLGINPNDARAMTAVQKAVPILRGMSKSPRPFRTSQSFANFADRQAAKYFEKHHEDLADALKGAQVTVGEDQMALSKALEERASLNKRLNKYDAADPKTQGIMEETNPKLHDDLARRDAVRDAINSTIDAASPQSASQADIMRNYSHLKEVAEIAVPRAKQLEAMRVIARGSREPIGTLLKDTAIQAATGTLAGRPLKWTAAQRARILRGSAGTSLDPEIAFGRASRRFQYVKPAAPITPVPKALPAGTLPDYSGIVPTNPNDVALSPYGQRMLPPAGGSEVIPSSGQTLITEPPASFTAAEQFRQLPNTTTIPQQRMLPPATGPSIQPSSGQTMIPPPTVESIPASQLNLRQVQTPWGQTGTVENIRGDYSGVRLATGELTWVPTKNLQTLTPTPTISPVPQIRPISGGSGLPEGVTPKGDSWMGTLYDVDTPMGKTTIVANDPETLAQKVAALRQVPKPIEVSPRRSNLLSPEVLAENRQRALEGGLELSEKRWRKRTNQPPE